MKWLLRSLLILCFAITSNGHSQTTTPPSEYAALVARVKSGDVYINFKRLRMAYAASPERKNAKDTQKEKNLSAEVLFSDTAKAIEYIDIVLENDYTNITAHLLAGNAYRRLKDDDKSKFHQAIAKGLLDSILEQSGESKKDAWIVISEEEEKTTLALLQMHTTSHTLIKDGKHTYEMVEVVHPLTHQIEKRYFNIDLVPK
jgi:Domain of unknown function (DUF4919)